MVGTRRSSTLGVEEEEFALPAPGVRWSPGDVIRQLARSSFPLGIQQIIGGLIYHRVSECAKSQ
jgi:hypothetical protein